MSVKTPYDLFHIECNEGWKGLYQPLIDLCVLKNIQILQIKEKFGGLRFYAAGEKLKDIQDLIDAAEARSYHMCENCGETGRTKHVKQEDGTYKEVPNVTTSAGSGYWIRTLCPECREKWEERE